jgi:fructose-bisphosphate aldolase class II
VPLVDTRQLMNDAAAGHGGLAAFNIITLEHAEAVVTGASDAGLPVILQLSENAVKFHDGDVRPLMAAARCLAEAAAVPVSLHLDHVESQDLLHRTASSGASSVMFDASRLDFEANVEATRLAAAWAHDQGLYIEAELGAIGGKGGAHAPGARTDPSEAQRFVEATSVDALAVAVGSTHAMTTRDALLDQELIRELHAALPVPLVLHGSSGVPDHAIRQAIGNGITKINVGTLLNTSYTGAVRRVLAADDKVVDPRRYLTVARLEVAASVALILEVIRGAGGQ